MSNENKLSTAPAGAVAQKTAGGGALSVFADGASFNTALRMAQCLASSTVVPKEYHGNVGNCMIAIEMASRINTSPMMVMQNLYIVNGRPAWSSQWIIAMINSSRRYTGELSVRINGNESAALRFFPSEEAIIDGLRKNGVEAAYGDFADTHPHHPRK